MYYIYSISILKSINEQEFIVFKGIQEHDNFYFYNIYLFLFYYNQNSQLPTLHEIFKNIFINP